MKTYGRRVKKFDPRTMRATINNPTDDYALVVNKDDKGEGDRYIVNKHTLMIVKVFRGNGTVDKDKIWNSIDILKDMNKK